MLGIICKLMGILPGKRNEPLPVCQTLLLELHNGVLHITLNRPDSRNAMRKAHWSPSCVRYWRRYTMRRTSLAVWRGRALLRWRRHQGHGQCTRPRPDAYRD
jgi:hypothetical protein